MKIKHFTVAIYIHVLEMVTSLYLSLCSEVERLCSEVERLCSEVEVSVLEISFSSNSNVVNCLQETFNKRRVILFF